MARELAPAVKIVTMGRNRGFAGGANVGAAAATGDLLVILNPDAMPLPGWGEAIRRPWLEGRGWDVHRQASQKGFRVLRVGRKTN